MKRSQKSLTSTLVEKIGRAQFVIEDLTREIERHRAWAHELRMLRELEKAKLARAQESLKKAQK